MHEDGTDKDKLAHAGVRGGLSKPERTLGVNGAVEFGGLFLAAVMYSRGEMHYGLDALQRGPPIQRRSDRVNQEIAVVPGWCSNGATESPPAPRQ
jgi:hypothetical protein